jgi:hypothetical protein
VATSIAGGDMSGERMVRLTMTQEQYHALRHKLDRLPWTSSEEAAVRVLVAAFDAASPPASDPRFAQIRDLLAVWAGEGSKIGAAYAIASAAAAGEPVSPREPCALCGDSRQDPFTPGACPACAYEYERGDDG